MKKTLFLTLSLGFAFSSLHADTFTLKNGLEYTGKISLETKDTYYLLVEVKPGVRKEVAVKKSDIESITEASSNGASRDFTALKKLIPTPDLLSAGDYERAISNTVDPFIKKYPKSREAKQANEIRDTLNKELELVKNGALKIDGKFTSEEDRAHNAYEIEASLLANEINKLARAKKYSEAFSAFSEMSEDYKNTAPFQDTLKQAIKLFSTYETQAKRIANSADDAIIKRDKALDAMTTDTRIRAKQVLANEERAYQAKLTKAKSTDTKWLPLNRFHPEVAEKVLSSLKYEKSRFEQLAEKTENFDAGATYREAWEAFDKNELDVAKQKIHDLSRARVPDKYVDPLETKLDEAIDAHRELERQVREEEREAREKAREEARQQRSEEREETVDDQQDES